MTPDPGDGHRAIQELLPWWANGTLDTEDARRVEAHLEQCAACRREALLLTDLEAVLDEAPATARSAPDGGAHAPAVEAPAAAPRRSVVPWLGWAAAAVLALGLGLTLGLELHDGSAGRREGGSPAAISGGVVPTYRLDAVRRSGAETVLLPEGPHTTIQLLLHVDLGAGALPLDVTLEDAEGRTVLRETGIRRLYEGRFLFLHCPASDVPPGRYRVILRGRGPEAPEEPVRYLFRVVAPSDHAPEREMGAGAEDEGGR